MQKLQGGQVLWQIIVIKEATIPANVDSLLWTSKSRERLLARVEKQAVVTLRTIRKELAKQVKKEVADN
jgi:hypothetical protein